MSSLTDDKLAVSKHTSGPYALQNMSLANAVPVREASVVVLGGLALFFLLAILSYSPFDSAWTYQSEHTDVRNLVGRSGAFAADLLVYLLGRVAYVVPFVLVFFGVRLLRSKERLWSWPRVALRIAGVIGALVCCAALLSLHWPAGMLPAGVGGVLGRALVTNGMPLFNWIGLSLLLSTALLVAVQAALGFSWFAVLETLGRGLAWVFYELLRIIDNLRDRLIALRERRAERRVHTSAQAGGVNGFSASATAPAPVHQPPAVQVEKPRLQRVDQSTAETALTATTPEARVAPRLGAEKQGRLFPGKPKGQLPMLELLDEDTQDPSLARSEESLETMSRLLEMRLKDFNIVGEVVGVLPGPVVTRFELEPAPGTKVQKITALVKDLARSLAVISVRVVEVIPGKSVVGIEIPNEHREMVRLKGLLEADNYQSANSPLTLALGHDIAGNPIIADIAKMPHLLVAGTTGSGKSVGVNSMLLSILYKAKPEEVRLILVDPKMLELSIYEGIPHLLTPVVTDMKEAAHALNWCVAEMERRYRLMSALGVRNLAGFNDRVAAEEIADPLWPADSAEAAPALTHLPLIVVVIDEFADMMMIVGKKVEQLIARIAQKARAAGIHLVLATQRPSVDVITGLIKANIPTRISFQVSSKVDSRTILDQGGAEQLLGHGDMLFLPPGTAVPTRVHGAFVSDDEVHRLVADWKQRGAPDYLPEVLTGGVDEPFLAIESNSSDTEQDDELYDEAVAFVLESRRASTSSVQRKLRVGYNRAARLIDAMEAAGVVSAMNSNGSREILVPNHRE